MKILKKLILGLLIASSINTGTFGMADDASAYNLMNQPDPIIYKICRQLLSDLDPNTHDGLSLAVGRLDGLRDSSVRFKDLLTYKEIARMLIARGLNVMATNKFGYIFGLMELSKAAEWGCIAVVRVLLEVLPQEQRLNILITKISPHCLDGTALDWAAFRGRTEAAKAILEALSIDQRINLVMAYDRDYITALHSAALNDYTEVAKVLLEAIPKDQRINLILVRSRHGDTALHLAARYGHAGVARMLIGYYASLRLEIPQDLLPRLARMGVRIEE